MNCGGFQFLLESVGLILVKFGVIMEKIRREV